MDTHCRAYTNLSVCAYIYVYIHTYIHTYLPTYIHTYIYIYMLAPKKNMMKPRGNHARSQACFLLFSFVQYVQYFRYSGFGHGCLDLGIFSICSVFILVLGICTYRYNYLDMTPTLVCSRNTTEAQLENKISKKVSAWTLTFNFKARTSKTYLVKQCFSKNITFLA